MMNEPICPKCGEIIEQFDIIDREDTDDEMYDLILVGECPKCGRQYRWHEVYRFYGVDKLEEIS